MSFCGTAQLDFTTQVDEAMHPWQDAKRVFGWLVEIVRNIQKAG